MSGEHGWMGIGQSCKQVLFVFSELYEVPVSSTGKGSQALKVCHLPASGAALGRKGVLAVQDMAGC